MKSILQVKKSITPELMRIPGTVGIGIQKGKIIIYTKKTTNAILSVIPLTTEGFDIKVIEIGEIFASQERTDSLEAQFLGELLREVGSLLCPQQT